MMTPNCLSKKSINKRISWPGSPPAKQYFSLLERIVYYIARNPATPEMYHKMVQCCKYFFEKQPLLVIARIRDNGKKIMSNDHNECYNKNRKCCVSVDLNKLSSKLWLTGVFCVSQIPYNNSANISVASKFYRCDTAVFYILAIEITLNEFQIIALFFKVFGLTGARIVDNNGNIVMIEKVLEVIPNVKDFLINFCPDYPAATTKTLENITKLQNLDNLRNLDFGNIPVVFNIDNLTKFIMDPKWAKCPRMCFNFFFNTYISQEYKNQLDALIDTINASEIPRRLIYYAGQDQKKCEIMEARCSRKL